MDSDVGVDSQSENTLTHSEHLNQETVTLTHSGHLKQEIFPDASDSVPQEGAGEAAASALASGFIRAFQPDLERSKGRMEEICRGQHAILESLENENHKFSESEQFRELQEKMKKAKEYYEKLMKIKSDMTYIHQKVGKVKKAALKMTISRERQLLSLAERQRREEERERQLMAKPAPGTTKTTTPLETGSSTPPSSADSSSLLNRDNPSAPV